MSKQDDKFRSWLGPHRKGVKAYVEDLLAIGALDSIRAQVLEPKIEKLQRLLERVLDRNTTERDWINFCQLLDVDPKGFQDTIELIKKGDSQYELASPDKTMFFRFRGSAERMNVLGPEGGRLTVFYLDEAPWVIEEHIFNTRARWDSQSAYIHTDTEAEDGVAKKVRLNVRARTLEFVD